MASPTGRTPAVSTDDAPAVVRVAQGLLRRAAEHGGPGPLQGLVADLARLLVSRRRMRRALGGNWLGHAAHPMLTDFTDGPWMAASFLDLFGPEGSESASRRLVGFGLLASVPTMLSGLADWSTTEDDARRVGLVHAATSTTATVLYGASYLARRRSQQRLGVALGVVGGIVAYADGYVGGELSLVARTGTGRRT